jgi:hypothetical protein
MRFVLCSLLLLATTVSRSCAERPAHDAQHESHEPCATLYYRSPFVHGYRDGYQQGFHDADISMQFAHEITNPMETRSYHDVKFRNEFGDRKSFEQGFRAGYVLGFNDMKAARTFRVFDILKPALTLTLANQKELTRPEQFNRGVAHGYDTARKGVPAFQRSSMDPLVGVTCTAANVSFCTGIRVGAAIVSAEPPAHK